MVWSLTVTFASPVTLGTNAITLSQAGGSQIPISITNPSGDDETYVITFTGSDIIDGSLPNGAYDLTIHSALVTVTSTGEALAGSDQTFAFYRLFGDLGGNGTLTGVDTTAMSKAYGSSVGARHYNEALDYDGSHTIDLGAYNAFLNDGGLTQSAMGTLDLYYDDRGQVIEEQQAGQTTAQYVWSPFYVNQLVDRDDEPSSSGVLTRRLYVEQDANFNVTSLTDASGNVVERYVYDPYGTVTVENPDGSIKGDGALASSSFGMEYLFQGGRIDPQTGLYHFGARDYDPTAGRWEEQDPEGYVDGPSRYQFDDSAPTELVDPDGTRPQYEMIPEGGGGALSDGDLGDVGGPDGGGGTGVGEGWGGQPLADPQIGGGGDVGGGPVADPAQPVTGDAVGPDGEPENAPGDDAPPAAPWVPPLPTTQPLSQQQPPAPPSQPQPQSPPAPATQPASPSGQQSAQQYERTPAQNQQARNKFKNNKDAAKQGYTDRTGKPWPQDANGKDWPAHHDPSLKSGGDPMNVVPQDPDGVDPHSIVGPDGLTDYERWGAMGTPARKAKQSQQ
jgi:RHS repeat-associated protein